MPTQGIWGICLGGHRSLMWIFHQHSVFLAAWCSPGSKCPLAANVYKINDSDHQVHQWPISTMGKCLGVATPTVYHCLGPGSKSPGQLLCAVVCQSIGQLPVKANVHPAKSHALHFFSFVY